MAGEPLSAPSRADTTDPALEYACEHLERLGYQLVEHHHDGRTGARLLILTSHRQSELVFCELRAETFRDPSPTGGDLRRRRVRRAALAWLAANRPVRAESLRIDRLTVVVGGDGVPIGLGHEPQAF
jgi:Holliday junction resolvase-like predicted endonuclease